MQSPVAVNVNDVKAPERHRKHVAVPDISDDVDPWAASVPTPQGMSDSMRAPDPMQAADSVQAMPQDDDDPWNQPLPQPGQQSQSQPFLSRGRERPANDPWSQRFAAPEPAKPQVAAEDDEYSMSDESLGTATALDVDELSRIFEVKKIEDFTADDPKNPRNMQTKKSLDD